ncbi:MAG TPA: PAS domain S-box protein [Blastocatellia bacterium]|nr:PAS domain S-box protein [Blastocatellia bacterium]
MKTGMISEPIRPQTEDLFSKAFSSNPHPISITTISEGRFIEANESFLAMVGYSREELIGRTTIELEIWTTPGDRARMTKMLARQNSIRNLEVAIRSKSGELYIVLLSAEVIELYGESCMLATSSDITDRNRAERVQAATYKISEAANSAENLQALFRSIHEIVGQLMPANNFYIALYDREAGYLSFPYFTDEADRAPSPRSLGRGLTEYVLRTGEPLHAPPEILERLVAEGEAELIGPDSIDWFGVPLKTRHETIGALVVQSYTEGVRFELEEQNILSFVSTQVAMAIERKRAEDALRASEELFSKAFNASPLAMSITRFSDRRFIDVNDSFLRVTGYDREDFLGRSGPEMGIWPTPEERARVPRIDESQSSVRGIECRLRLKSGAIHTFLLSAEVIEIGGEKCVLTVIDDITERKQAEEQRVGLLVSEKAARIEAEHIGKLYAKLFDREQAARSEAEAARREWQTTFDTMADYVVLADRDDRLVRANLAFYEGLGLKPENSIGRSVEELMHAREKNFPADEQCPICELRLKGERAVIELPEGVITNYPVAVSIDPITNDEGETTGVVQVVRDLSDLYRAREQAERERTSLNATIEQMAEGMIVCDETGSIILANNHAKRVLRIESSTGRADIISALAEGRFTDEEGRAVSFDELPVRTALREQRIVESLLWYERPSEKRLLLSITASPFFTDQSQLAGAIVLLRDVTQQQREHERAQQADKLRALGQLASGVAHNFNNALAAVIGYTQLALRKVNDQDVEKYLRVIEQSSKDAARMVERIQNFSRGRLRTDDFVAVRISEIVRDAIEITRPRWRNDAEALGIKYEVRLQWDAEEDVLVSGEPSELREVFVNVIFNALDAMPLGGRLSVYGSLDDASVRLRFTDKGGGMTEEIKRRIFEPFFTTKGAAGLGMGLSESYRIIERHSGRIDVESQVRHGTTFTITLPLAHALKPVTSSESACVPPSRAQVLVIDDEEYVRDVLAAILAEQGHEATCAGSAEEALRLLDEHNFDIVFTDLAMPKVDGIAAATEIKARRPQTKIVLMSGYGADRARERAADTNCIDTSISKPFRMNEIQAALKTVLK